MLMCYLLILVINGFCGTKQEPDVQDANHQRCHFWTLLLSREFSRSMLSFVNNMKEVIKHRRNQILIVQVVYETDDESMKFDECLMKQS